MHFVVVKLGVAGAAASDCSIEGGLLPSSSDGSLPGGAVRLTVSELSWLRGRGPELLLRYHVRVAHFPVVDWARILHRPPTASPVILGTGVLWVSTGTHPCGSPSRQDDGETRAPALHTLDDVLRFRGDEEYRAVLLHAERALRRVKEGTSAVLLQSGLNESWWADSM